jgi:hypothetical protein
MHEPITPARDCFIPSNVKRITPELLPLIALDQSQIDAIVSSVPGGERNVQDIYPLSPLQEGILFHRLLDERDTYVLSVLLALPSRERIDDLVTALNRVIARHDILRSAVLWEHLPRPLQVVYRSASLPVEEIALDERHDAVLQLREQMKPQAAKQNLRQAPLMRLQVTAKPYDGNWYAVLRVHHLVCDHQTLMTILAESASYLTGRDDKLPPSSPYRSYIAQVLADDKRHAAEAYFRSRLSDIREPTAPFGLFDVRGDGNQSKESFLTLDALLAERVRTQAKRLHLSPARLFHTAWALVVARTTGLNEVVYGTVLLASQQRGAQAQRMLGMAVNTLPLRLGLQGVTAEELAKQTHQELSSLLQYEEAPLTLAQSCSGVEGTAPLFTSVLNFRHTRQDTDAPDLAAAGIRFIARDDGWTNYPVAVTVDDPRTTFSLRAQTDRRVDPTRIVQYLQTAVQSLVKAL